MTKKYPEKVPYVLSKNNLENRLLELTRNNEDILVRVIEVKKDGDRKGNRTVLVKHVLENNTELVLAKYLQSVTKNKKYVVNMREFKTKQNKWKSEQDIKDESIQYSHTGKYIDRFVERIAIIKNSYEHETIINVSNKY